MNNIPDNRIDHNKHSVFCSQKPKWCGSTHCVAAAARAATNFTDTKIYAIPYVYIWAV